MPVPSDFVERQQRVIAQWKLEPPGLAGEQYLGDNPFHHFVLTEQAASWREYLDWIAELTGSWCFRGQREALWTLATSMDRASTVEYSTPNGSGYHHLPRTGEERELLHLFKEQAPRHVETVPEQDDTASWLAMMQHYGVPTRLLDWTQSPHIGLYFALDDPPEGTHAALWALDLAWLETTGKRLGQPTAAVQASSPDEAFQRLDRLLYETKEPLILSIDPPTVTDRMTAQQGLLLFNTIEGASFSQMLMSMIVHGGVPPSPAIRKLEIARELRIEVLERLREMKIDSSALFPGLAGFGQSLRFGLEIKVHRASEAAVRHSLALEAEFLGRRRQTRKGTAAPETEGV